MILKYQEGDLLKLPRTYYLAHCISADFIFSTETAKRINYICKMRFKLNNRYGTIPERVRIGKVFLVDNVFNLVTHGRFYNDPSYRSLKCSLYKMKNIIVSRNISYLAMPYINQLAWDRVEDIIKEVFNDTDIEITVFNAPNKSTKEVVNE